MRNERSSSARGFTLIELLIVVAVIGILAGLALVSLAGALDKAKQRATMADMRTVARSIEAYIVDNHNAPDDAGGLVALITVLVPYQSDVLPTQDHWDRELGYVTDGAENYTLESYGRDGVAGGDITYDQRFDYDLDIVLVNGSFVSAPE